MSLLDGIYRWRKRPNATVTATEEVVWVNPVAHHIHTYKERTRGKLAEGMVEVRAKRLHAESSFAPWDRLSEVDKELWVHMARMELMGDGTPPVAKR